MFEAVEMEFVWARIQLGEFNAGICKIRTTRSHGPYQFADP
jgi:hypothetical protein